MTGILLLGVALRVSYFSEIIDAPDFAHPLIDAAFHDYWARGLTTGDWTPAEGVADPEIPRHPYFRPPGYPYSLALTYALSGGSRVVARVVQMALGLVSVVLAYRLGRRLSGSSVGLISAALMSVYWVFIYFEGELLAPVLLVFLGLGVISTVQHWTAGFTYPRAVLSGLLLGLFALVRPNILLFVPVLLGWAWWVARRRKDGRRFRVVLLGFLPSVTATIAPATVRNYRVADDFVLITANAGVNLYIGNNERTDCVWPSIPMLQDLAGTDTWNCFDYPKIVRGLERQLGASLKYSEVSNYFAKAALAYMCAHPGRTLELMVQKAALFWGPAEISNNKVIHYEREHSRTLRYLPGFPFILSLAVVGALLLSPGFRSKGTTSKRGGAERRDRLEVVVLIFFFIATYFVSFLPFFVAARYRVPIIPFLILLGACGVQRFGRLVVRRDFKRSAGAVVIGAGLYALANVSFYPYEPDLGRWYYDRGQAYSSAGDTAQAVNEYRESVRLNPNDYRPRVNLGLELSKQGRVDEAVTQFVAAVRIKPDLAMAYRNLGLLLERKGNIGAAINAYRRALDIDPHYKNALVSLGHALRERGETTEALRQYRIALELDPHDPVIHNGIGVALSAQGRVDEARQEYFEALRLDPGHADAHYNLGNLFAEQGVEAEAVRHYRAAILLVPGFVQAQGNLGAVLARQGNFEGAVKACRTALGIDANYVSARYNLAGALKRLGRIDEAIAEYRKVLQIDPEHSGARRALETMEAPRNGK